MKKGSHKKAHPTLQSVMSEQGIPCESMSKRLGISINAFNERMQGIVEFSLTQTILISQITDTSIDRLSKELSNDSSVHFSARKVPYKEHKQNGGFEHVNVILFTNPDSPHNPTSSFLWVKTIRKVPKRVYERIQLLKRSSYHRFVP